MTANERYRVGIDIGGTFTDFSVIDRKTNRVHVEKVLTTPIKTVAELLSNNAIGREASLEHVTIRERVGDRYLWIGSGDERPIFVVLDPDVKRDASITLRPGAEVTLIGIVRPAPKTDEAAQQWRVTPATAKLIEESGTYLHVTEIR